MQDNVILKKLKSLFYFYADSFVSSDPGQTVNILLKKEHTERVCADVLEIAQSLTRNQQDLFIAEAAALFHDVGRFEQYARYHTF